VVAVSFELRDAYSQIELLTGGGVRNVGDLRHLAASGCDAVLVASALHDGRLTAADLARI
jgi:phosphoribosylformimino-5-aminoimidazole carboxamide ribotide isomerase